MEVDLLGGQRAGGGEVERRGVRTLVETAADIELLGEATTAAEAEALIERTRPDIAVTDLCLPDRSAVEAHQTESFQWGRLGRDLQDGAEQVRAGEGWRLREQTYGARAGRARSGARGALPFGPVPKLRLDTVFSVLEVDRVVERWESSAAPVYPADLLALGAEGDVRATYVVDTTGTVDTATIRVLASDDPRFTESVRMALGGMRFRPAVRRGTAVRQLVEQRFRFRIDRPAQGVSTRCEGCRAS